MTKGYMLWTKGRSGATDHAIYDSERGVTKDLVSNTTAAETTQATGLKSVSSTGHTIGSLAKMNTSAATYVDFVFRKAPKFFDVVTYTGDGVAGRQVAHDLGVAPGMVIIKKTSASGDNWAVWHRGSPTQGGRLNLADAFESGYYSAWVNSTQPTSSVFTVSSDGTVNANGQTYVAYLFAHDTTADGIIQCGSYVGNGSATGPVINLGWEPQYVMIKASSRAASWTMFDNMRGISTGGLDAFLSANEATEESSQDYLSLLPTGFQITNAGASRVNESGQTYIYLAIRRPNKPPTSGTQVYNAIARTGTGAAATVTGVGFAPDLIIPFCKDGTQNGGMTYDRLRGPLLGMFTSATNAESSLASSVTAFNMDGVALGTYGDVNSSTKPFINWFFRRAVGVFDEVCYTGSGSSPQVLTHNLTVTPEMMIVKFRDGSTNWYVYTATVGNTGALYLDGTGTPTTSAVFWNNTSPTATQFTVGSFPSGAGNYVAYLFATKAGISFVGSYTGNGGTADSAGTSQTINCGFTTGSRFVMIKCTSHTSDWVVIDTTRGLIAGNDPTLSLNTAAAEVTGQDLLDPDNSGFIVNQLGSAAGTSANFNVTGRTYIVLSFA
jgi:hypothetical protein